MKSHNIYKTLILVSFAVMSWGLPSAHAQTDIFEFKLQLIDSISWGVYVRSDQSATFSTNTQFSNAQATVVAPTGFQFTNLTSVNGIWLNNATNVAPTENSARDYISFGSLPGSDITVEDDGTELLLFSFELVGSCPDTLYLIDNATDPFNVLPNSAGNNPGNNFDYIDIGNGFSEYDYLQNYAPSAWSCHDCDGDGILNGEEDTNGNGVFDVGVDTTDMCDICDPIHPDTAFLSLAVGADSVICAGDIGDNIVFTVDISGGWPPYTVVYTDGNGTYTENNYTSGDPITYTPTASGTLSLVSVTDNEGCVAAIGDLEGSFDIVVEGPISFSLEPVSVSECSGNPVTFTSTAGNAGDGNMYYQWQISTDNGSTFLDLPDGTPYSNAETDALTISDIAGLNAIQYRVKIFTESCDTVFSAAAILTVEGPISTTLDPVDQSICDGENVTFMSGASNSGQGSLSNVWQVSSDNGSTFTDLADAGVYSGTGTITLNMTGVDNSYNGFQYRMKAWTVNCDTVYSAPAILTVEGPLVITTHPSDIASCAGNPVFFTLEFTSGVAGDVTYQWQYNDQTNGWLDLNDDDIYNGTETDTLSVADVEGLDGYQYQVLITTGSCATVTSNPATLTIDGPITYTLHPVDLAICHDETATFTANATINQGSITYQWQVSADGSSFTDISDGLVYSGTNTGTLTISDLTGLDGMYYQVLAQTASCDDVPSLIAQLTVEGPFTVDANGDPEDRTVCDGDPVSFDASISNGNSGALIYQWQVKIGALAWQNISNNSLYSGANTDFLGINNSSGLNGNQYRLCITTANCTATPFYTAAATLTVEGPVTFSTDPSDVTLCSGDATSFTAVPVNATGEGTMSLVWQVSTDGINFSSLTEGQAGIYTGVATQTLNISNVAGLYGRCYRLQVTTGECSEVNSGVACLTVEGPVTIDADPVAVTQCDGEPVVFAVDVTNSGDGDIFYQWQENTGSGWNDIVNDDTYNGATTDSLSISDVAGLGGNEYQVIITAGTCSTQTSASASLTVEGPLSYTTQPQDVTQCSGLGTSFDVTVFNAGAGGQASIQWQYSDNGGPWTNVPDVVGDVFDDPTSSVLVITDVAGLNGYSFRTVSSTSTCSGVISNEATLTVEGPISITNEPDDLTVCDGSGASFSIETANTGEGAITYQWQFRTSSGGAWNNVSNSSLFNGATTANLSLSAVSTVHDGWQFQCIIQTSTCSSVVSTVATLTIEGPITFTSIPQDVTQCAGEGTTFSVVVDNGLGGTVNIQWQVSTDGINYANVPDDAVYDDVTTATLVINDVDGLNGRCYRAAVTTSTCTNTYSDPGCLTVEGPLTITQQPTNSVICSDLGTTFVVNVSNPGEGDVIYQWQENSGSGWANLENSDNINGVSTDTLSIDEGLGLNGYQYRVLVSSASCNQIISDVVTITVDGPLTITDHPDDVTICSPANTSFSVSVDNATAGNGISTIYQWQFSSNNGATWSNVTDDAVYSGSNSATLSLTNTPPTLTSYKYKCLVSTANCAISESESATLFVQGPITFPTQPVDASICSNVGHTFSAVIANAGAGNVSLQWEFSANAGSTWTALTNTGVYAGTTTQDLFISLTDGLDQYMYRLLVTTSECTEYSNEVTLTVRDACLDGTCDFDLDGLDNDTDEDDDNDGLDDFWEDYITANSLAMVGVQHTMDNCNPDSDGDGITDDQEDPDEDEYSNGEETDGDMVFDGDPLDPCDPVLSASCIGITLDLKVMLQGAMMGSPDALMRDDLRSGGYIPTTEPYTSLSAFEHKGNGGGETINASVLSVTGDDAIVDWMFIELRSSIKLDSVIATRSALLQRDGDIVDLDGTSLLFFDGIVAGPYYVAIRHRNHLGAMTIESGELSPIVTEFDFTDTSIVWHGTNPMYQKDGKNMLWAGDFNMDRKLIYQGPDNDISDLFSFIFQDQIDQGVDPGELNANHIGFGYLLTDIDLDGDSVYQGPDNDRSKHLFQVVLPYPDNGSLLTNYVILEQLP